MAWVAGAAFFLAAPGARAGDVSLGLQGSWSEDFEYGVGARLNLDLSDRRAGLAAAVTFDYFFPEAVFGVEPTYWELNGSLIYKLGDSNLQPYVGTGLNLAHASVSVEGVGSASEDEIGVNLLGGVKLGRSLFGEVRYEIKGGEQLVISVGFLF